MTSRRRYRPRPRVYGRFGCIGCSLPLLAALAVLAAMVAAPYLMTLPGHILAGLGDMGHLLMAASRSLVQGLISGIESAAGGVLARVESMGRMVLAVARSVLNLV